MLYYKQSGFSIEAGTWRLITAYFGICSHLLCILFTAFPSLVCGPSICHSSLLQILLRTLNSCTVVLIIITKAPSRQVANWNPLPMTRRLFCWYNSCAKAWICSSRVSTSLMRSVDKLQDLINKFNLIFSFFKSKTPHTGLQVFGFKLSF